MLLVEDFAKFFVPWIEIASSKCKLVTNDCSIDSLRFVAFPHQHKRGNATKRVKAVLRDNNYPSSFSERSLSKLPTDVPSNGFVVLPYVQGISERISRLLRQQQIKVAFKPLRTLNSFFPRPKAQERVDRPHSGTVYKISCTNCSFVYFGQTERSLKTRIAEHKRAVSIFDHNSKISTTLRSTAK